MFYFEPLSHLVSERCRGPQALPKPWLLCLLPCPLKAIGHERGLRWLLEQQRISVAQACPEMGSQVMPRLMGKMRIWTSGFRIWILQTNLCEPWSCGWLRILYGRSKSPELPLKSLKLRISRIHSDSHPKKKPHLGTFGKQKLRSLGLAASRGAPRWGPGGSRRPPLKCRGGTRTPPLKWEIQSQIEKIQITHFDEFMKFMKFMNHKFIPSC